MERYNIKGNATSPGLNLSPDCNGDWVKAADAQATVEALQARVRTATQLIIAEIGASGPEDLEEAVGRIVGRLQQRTAELEAAKAECDELREHKQDAIHYLRRALQEAEIPVASEGDIAVSKVKDLVRKVNDLHAELERVRAEKDRLEAAMELGGL